jgi:hypothetical protein
MNSLGMSGVTPLRNWCIGLFSRERANLTQSWIEGLGVYLGTPYGVPMAGTTLWLLGSGVGGTRNGCSCGPLRWRRM